MRTRTAGYTLVEVLVVSALLVPLLGATLTIADVVIDSLGTTDRAADATITLDRTVERIERLARPALVSRCKVQATQADVLRAADEAAGGGTEPVPALGDWIAVRARDPHATIELQAASGVASPGASRLDPPRRLEFRLDDREAPNGTDDDGDLLVDEGSLVLAEATGRVVLATGIEGCTFEIDGRALRCTLRGAVRDSDGLVSPPVDRPDRLPAQPMTTPLATPDRAASDRQDGVALITILTIMLPLMVFTGFAVSTMTSRNNTLLAEVRNTRAFLAAESGIDEGIYRAKDGTLVPGRAFARDLGEGAEFAIDPVLLRTDGLDNDGDGQEDEPDENFVQLTVTGTHGKALVRLATYLAQSPGTPPPATDAAITVFGPTALRFSGNGASHGHNKDLDGSPGGPGTDKHGIAAVPPLTVATVKGALRTNGNGEVTGVGGTNPDVAPAVPVDLAALVEAYRRAADIVLATNSIAGGVATTARPKIVYRNGDFSSNAYAGAGVLVVTGTMKVAGNFRWDGLVICLGDYEASGKGKIYGSLLLGPSVRNARFTGNGEVVYSAEGLAFGTIPGPYDVPTGWQEIARH